ncbi:uncharacterized protein LOC128857316 [Anastrepha ludens]|uniref:uncharacterized protein LOC128857316 n=1 Tax=Anastrepha ludens TaxID=28586 RepID=UPI0023B16DCC|nr:uncharacterized protein LOC128857316 [Anastrepha ludens]
MDILDSQQEKDGMELIIEPGYTWDELRENIANSCLKKKCDFLLQDDLKIEDRYKKILDLLNAELNLDEITSLFVIAGTLYFIEARPENMEWRTLLLQKTFNYTDTLSPMHLHLATKRLWTNLKKKDTDVFNILELCNQMVIISETARAISICLMWTILSEITETPSEMYCFRQFSKLLEMLNNIDSETLQEEENTKIVYILVRVLSYLINVTLCDAQNEDIIKAGYRMYFKYTSPFLKKLHEWCENFKKTIDSCPKPKQNQTDWDLRMMITEHISFNIINVLQDRIEHMSAPDYS